MKWTWRLGKIAGIDVNVHVTFTLLIGWIALSHWIEAGTLESVISGTAFIMAIFLCVVLHEYGHALTARRYGIGTKDITLLPIGGLARLERMPEKPSQEFWVALAGPAVNVGIALLLFGWLTLSGTFRPLSELDMTHGPLLERLMLVNVGLVLFNLLPAFPMDGGRMLRAALALRMDHTRATTIAAGLGQILAFGFGIVGLFMNPFLMLIAIFVWFGAAQEASATQVKAAITGTNVHAAMVTAFRSLRPEDTVADASNLLLRGSQREFPIVDQGRVIGILTQPALLRALREHGEGFPVSAVMSRDFRVARPGELLSDVLQKLAGHECQAIPVIDEGRLVGLVTTDNLGEFLLIQSARKGASAYRQGFGLLSRSHGARA